jgi:hypothetical protein
MDEAWSTGLPAQYVTNQGINFFVVEQTTVGLPPGWD